jgi:hypothetical protein
VAYTGPNQNKMSTNKPLQKKSANFSKKKIKPDLTKASKSIQLTKKQIFSSDVQERLENIENNICTNLHDFDQAILRNAVFPMILKHLPQEIQSVPAIFSPLSEIYADYFSHFWARLMLVKQDSGNYFKIPVGGEYRSLWHPQIYVLSQEAYGDDLGKFVSKAIRASLKNLKTQEDLEKTLELKFENLNGKRYLQGDLEKDINDYELRAFRTPELEVVDAFLQKIFPLPNQTYNPDMSLYKLMETVKNVAQTVDKIMFHKRKVMIFMKDENALYVKTKLGSKNDPIPAKVGLTNLAEFVFISRIRAAKVLKKLNVSEEGVSQRHYGAVVRYINWLVKVMNIEKISDNTKDVLETELMLLFRERDRLLQEISGVEKVFEFKFAL